MVKDILQKLFALRRGYEYDKYLFGNIYICSWDSANKAQNYTLLALKKQHTANLSTLRSLFFLMN